MAALQTLGDLVARFAARGGQPAVLVLRKDDIETWSYDDLSQHVQQLAQGLIAAGLGRREQVGIWANSRPEWMAACLAVLQAGGVAVPMDVQLGDKSLRHILRDSDLRLLFDVEQQDERSWQRLLHEQGDGLPELQPEDPAVLLYTSGTTGPPKGVPLDHGALAIEVNWLLEAELVTETDRVLLPLPLHHVYPLVAGTFAPLAKGLMPGLVPRRAAVGGRPLAKLQTGPRHTAGKVSGSGSAHLYRRGS